VILAANSLRKLTVHQDKREQTEEEYIEHHLTPTPSLTLWSTSRRLRHQTLFLRLDKRQADWADYTDVHWKWVKKKEYIVVNEWWFIVSDVVKLASLW